MISAVIITKNEEKMIGDCLKSLEFTDEIIVVDTGNIDDTNRIAYTAGARIVTSTGNDFSRFRTDGLNAAKYDWILYVDADERVTPKLRQEIIKITAAPVGEIGAYAIPRTNYYLGREMHYGGWGGDSVIRFFPKKCLISWKNPLHEQPIFEGQLGQLKENLVHFSHRDLTSMVNKTLEFTEYEAKLRFKINHPPVVWWRIFRVMGTEFWLRFVRLSAWRDGVEGCIDGIFQVFNTFIIYARLWEMQQEKLKHVKSPHR
jgi:glycosyltransferase involved in cell wall biosynthesis